MTTFFSFLILLQLFLVYGLKDGLHPTPPMGWSSWNTFFRENDEEKMMGIADSVVKLGLRDLGYIHLTVDDFWNQPKRDADTGDMVVNATRFPRGMKHLGEYLHSLGLKFGLYSDAGDFTCGGMAGSLGYEEQDVRTFLDFEIDYLKYDNCYPNGSDANIITVNIDFLASIQHTPSFYQDPPEKDRFLPMSNALKAVKHLRNITLELCLYGFGNVELWGPEAGHLWRTGYDIADNWPSVLRNVDRNDEERFWASQGPQLGAWNYADALFVQNGGMTDTEYRTMFALWCAVKSPLMIGSDLRNMEIGDPGHVILTNTELIAVNQDTLGVQAKCMKDCCRGGILGANLPDLTCRTFRDSWQIWTGPLGNDGNDYVVVVVNRFDEAVDVEMDWLEEAGVPEGDFLLRDMWAHEDLGTVKVGMQNWTGTLEAHDNWAFRLSQVTTTDSAAATITSSIIVFATVAISVSLSGLGTP